MKTLHTFATILGFALALTQPASAAIVTLNFQLTNPAQAVLGRGSYSYNDQAGVPNPFGETQFALTKFSFNFDDKSFALGDLDGGAGLALLGAGGQLLGLEAYRGGANPFSFLPAGPGTRNFFVSGTGAAALTLNIGTTLAVPTPGTLWLVAGLLPLLGALHLRRRRRAG